MSGICYAQQKDTLPVQLSHGGTTITGNVISATGGGGGGGSAVTFPIVATLPEGKFFAELRGPNYGTFYPKTKLFAEACFMGGYSVGASNTDDGSGNSRPDVVFMIAGGNVNANNARKDTRDGAWDYSVEDYYFIGSGFHAKEFHMPRFTDFAGTQHRLFSIYANMDNGGQLTFGSMELENLQFFSPVERWNYAVLEKINSGGIGANLHFRGQNTAGKAGSIQFDHEGKGVSEISGANGSLSFNAATNKGSEIVFNTAGGQACLGAEGYFHVSNGITSNGADVWKFGPVVNGNPTVIINGVTYALTAIKQ